MQLEYQTIIKESFAVIGKQGSTELGKGFTQKLWQDTNEHLSEVYPLAKKDQLGNVIGIWGAMSDPAMTFKPWENDYSSGLYLAGVEVEDDAQAPQGWVKWVIPGYEYLVVKNDNPKVFAKTIKYIRKNKMELVGAVQEFYCPSENQQQYMYFPIKELNNKSENL